MRLASLEVPRSEEWKAAWAAYAGIADDWEQGRHASDRKNRFTDLINCILAEAPKCGLQVPYMHHIEYGRYDYDGEIPTTRDFWKAAAHASEERYPWGHVRTPSPPHPSDMVPFQRKSAFASHYKDHTKAQHQR